MSTPVSTPVSRPTTAPGVRPVIVGSDIGVYALARSFHERYGVRTTVVAFAEPGPIANSRIIDLVLSGSSTDEIVATLARLAAEHSAARPGERLLLLTNMDWVVRALVARRTEL